MATITKWTPFEVALDITATGSTVTRTSATTFTVKINASWETYYSGALTNYGMTASSGGSSVTLNPFGTKSDGGSGSFTGTYSISGNSAATKTITVTFRNFNTDNGDSATKSVSFSVSVPAWTSYTVKYNANGGSGAPSSQTKWKDQTLTLSSTKPTRTGYSFQGWAISSSGSVAYAAGANYTANASVTLYAVWKANTYTVKYNANGGTGAPANQTKTHGVTLTLSSVKPTRTNYTFKGWGLSSSTTTVSYASGASYTTNAAITLYAVWELTYTKPKISGVSVARCDSEGTKNDTGTYALVKFNWTTSISVSSITIEWKSASMSTWSSITVSASGTSGSVSQIIGGGALSIESAYSIRITVTDGNDSSYMTTNLSGTILPIDFLKGGKGTAIGKPAELANIFDVVWLTRLRNHLCVGNKTGHLDGNTGAFLSYEGYIHLQRSTAQGYHPYIGFYLDDATTHAGMIRLNSSTLQMNFMGAGAYTFDNDTIATGNGYIGTTSSWEDGKAGVRLSKSGGIQIQRVSGSSPYLDFMLYGSSSYDARMICDQSDKRLKFKGAAAYVFEAGIIANTYMSLGMDTYSAERGINMLYVDGSAHWIMFRGTDGLTSNFGWAGSSSYSTITRLRGQTCQYQNTSGTTTLSDERLKKDFSDLEKWSAFYDLIEPCAFKMKDGKSGRYHIGFVAQQIEEALIDSGLTTQDFAGFVKTMYTVDEDDPERTEVYEESGIAPGDDEYGLIYTEFVALNTYKIQELQKENKELKTKVNSLEERLAALESFIEGIKNGGNI